LNPHAALEVCSGDATWERRAAGGPWTKWRPDWPTSAHWYTRATFASLIAAYLTEERRTGRARTVRELVAEFDGLSGSRKQKQVVEQAGLVKARLHDLLDGSEVNAAVAGRLLQVMQQSTRVIQPSRLGRLGEEHLRQSLAQHYRVRPATVRYKRKVGIDDGVPFVLEVAFAIKAQGHTEESRDLTVGLNWSPAVAQPLAQLDDVLAEMRVDCWDPVAMVVHLAYPCLEATDRGKGRYRLGGQALAALETCVRLTTKDWRKLKRHADREDRLAERDLEAECVRHERGRRFQIKDAAYAVMEQAYLQASDPGPYGAPGRRLPAEARQVMYAARPLVLERTGGDVWKNSDSFTQRLLPDFIDQHPRQTAGWDVVFGARGALEEPHTGRRVPLGTVDVRNYIADWRDDVPESIEPIRVGGLCPTSGPSNRFRLALFVEKQGFDALLDAGTIAARYDLAVMSTKGMSVTAARRLVEELSARDVTILVLRDFDKSGFSIAHTLRSDTRRYRFRVPPRVIDLGLHLKDARAMGLQSETVRYQSKKDPRERLRECGATEAECRYLVRGGGPGHWWGERVELNAMTALQFLQFLERKLLHVGVRKVTPDANELAKAYRRMWRLQMVQDAVNAAQAQSPDDVIIPANLLRQLRRQLKDSQMPWDAALQEIVQQQRQRPPAG
jgi:hypothetical protein